MQIHHSWLGGALSLVYLAFALWVVQDELRHSHGGWINLRGMGVTLVTAPSQVTFGVLLQRSGVRPVNYTSPGLLDYCQLVLHVAVTATLVYLLGYGIEWAVRRWLLT